MPVRFQPIIKPARFEPRGFQPQDMLGFGNTLLKSIQTRLDHAQTVNDNAAPPLKESYRQRKAKFGANPIRDLRLTGKTRRSMKVTEAGNNYAIISFTDPKALENVRYNQRRSRQWGVSPNDEKDLAREIAETLTNPVGVIQGGERKVA